MVSVIHIGPLKTPWHRRPHSSGTTQTYRILKFDQHSFTLDSFLLTVDSILGSCYNTWISFHYWLLHCKGPPLLSPEFQTVTFPSAYFSHFPGKWWWYYVALWMISRTSNAIFRLHLNKSQARDFIKIIHAVAYRHLSVSPVHYGLDSAVWYTEVCHVIL